ncbi:heavy metal-responsive transcriptional regulator [Acidithiobacillus sp.]|jgi:Cu(I)-responsive transcriptional regulator|uniref:heavy metal-responsive transcriptional regulator n=1 Tax=Acidithiobacillus sp. TaxID=1872118 RepID=UPI0025C716C6|nr:heavy metal-responsive transcriptional regulator [Acidithiobacillus sp.]MCK9189758.1 heavy metal-responsive transcriptional regulator [Acidithiobacillus sp.]MCK9360427.1 heavy metal-responsive transcriptional regulator [Acidithiobacillus sp.]
METPVTIGRLAREAGLAAETLRYYERIGLIRPVQRTQSNYRLYDGEAEARLRFIRRAQNLGFSLAEVKELLDISSSVENDMGEVKALTEQKLAEIDFKIADLQRMRTALAQQAERCPGHGSVANCPILASLADAGGAMPVRERWERQDSQSPYSVA